MATTKRTKSSEADVRMIVTEPGTKPKSALRILDATTKRSDRALLFRAVAERVRSCMLDPDEAAVIATWFDRLAAGDDARKVFFNETRGRPKGATGMKVVRGQEVRLPDHLDLAWSMRRAIAAGHAGDTVFAHVAKLYGVQPDTVRDIYEANVPLLADDPSLPK